MMISSCWCGGELAAGPHSDYRECRKCGTLLVLDQLGDVELREQYGFDAYWHENMREVNQPAIEQRAINDFRDRIPHWFNFVKSQQKTASTLFEIGCAHGGFLRYCLDRGFTQAHGCEVSPETCKFAREKFKLPVVAHGLFPDIPFDGLLPAYDVVCAFDVLEHFADPLGALKAIKLRMRSDSLLVMQAPWYRDEGSNWPQFKANEHLQLFNEKSLAAILTAAGLALLSFQRGLFPTDFMATAKCA